MTENTQEPPEFTEHADEVQWRGIYRDWALAGWTASRLQALGEAAKVAENAPLQTDRLSGATIAKGIAAAIRSLARERKDA